MLHDSANCRFTHTKPGRTPKTIDRALRALSTHEPATYLETLNESQIHRLRCICQIVSEFRNKVFQGKYDEKRVSSRKTSAQQSNYAYEKSGPTRPRNVDEVIEKRIKSLPLHELIDRFCDEAPAYHAVESGDSPAATLHAADRELLSANAYILLQAGCYCASMSPDILKSPDCFLVATATQIIVEHLLSHDERKLESPYISPLNELAKLISRHRVKDGD